MNLYTIGDSFTYGDELPDRSKAWPYLVAKALGYTVDNLAQPGASNDYIVRTTVNYLNTHTPDLVIIGWTIEDRLEIGGKTSNAHHNPEIFKHWDQDWANNKTQSQIIMMDRYILRDIPHYHCCTWIDDFYFKNMDNYVGRFVDWAYETPHGPKGHPLELGHRRIADEITKYVTRSRV
jgi:hypothetical protein